MFNIKPNPTSKRANYNSIARKLVKENERRARNSNMDGFALTALSQEIGAATLDAKRIRQLTPHILLIEKAILSTVLTSGVGETDQVDHLMIDTPKWSAGSSISGACVEVLKEHIENDYKISDNLNDMAAGALFEGGSTPVIVIPEAAIDKMIMDSVSSDANISMENDSTAFKSAFPDLHFLETDSATKVQYNLESDSGDSKSKKKTETKTKEEVRKSVGYGFTDALSLLVSPIISNKNRQLREKSAISSLMPKFGTANLENSLAAGIGNNKPNSNRFVDEYYKSVTRREVFKSLPHVKHVSEEGGQPIVIFAPSRSIIPITSPHDRRDHKGFICLIGANGYPVNETDEYSVDTFNSLAISTQNQASANIRTAYTAMFGYDGRRSQSLSTSQNIEEIYNQIVTNDINNVLERSDIDGTVTEVTEISRLMFARMLRNEYTRLLYIPKQFMTYIAYDYDDMGIGISLTERNKLLSTMYINLMMAKYISDFSNAINQQELTIDLDENDMDFENSIAQIREEFFSNRTGAANFFSTNPFDSITQLQRAGVTTVVNGGNHPNTKVTVRTVEGMRKTIDDGLLENIRRLHIMGYGAIPELIDSSFGVDYAAVQWLNNDMFVRMVSNYKMMTNGFLTDHIRKYTQFNHDLCLKLYQAIESNLDELSDNYFAENDITKEIDKEELKNRLLVDFLANVSVELPKLQLGSDQSIVESMNQYKDLLDNILDNCFNEASMSPAAIGQLSDHGFEPGEFKERIKAIKMREFCISKGVEPELVGLINKADKDPLPIILQMLVEEEDKLRRGLLEFWKTSIEAASKTNKLIAKTAEKLEAKHGEDAEKTLGSGDNVDYSSGSSTVDDTDDEFSLDSGMDDFSMGGDEPLEPEEPEAPEPSEPEEPAPAAEPTEAPQEPPATE